MILLILPSIILPSSICVFDKLEFNNFSNSFDAESSEFYKFPLIVNFPIYNFFYFKKHALLDKFEVFINIESLVFFNGEIRRL